MLSARMRTVSKVALIVAIALGLGMIGIGGFLTAKGLATKAEIRAELLEEKVTTSADAVNFGVPEGLPVQDAKTARAQANVIEMHSVDRYGRYTEMKRDDPGRAIYLDGLTLRNALGLAEVGFGVSNLAVAVGAVTIVLGLIITGLAVPMHIAILRSERLLKPERAVGGLREAPQTA